jgi:hypothetical protein
MLIIGNTTRDLIYWGNQLAYEMPKSRFKQDFPHYVYLVFVKNPTSGSVWAAHQDMNPPNDVIVLAKLGMTENNPESVPDYGRLIWKAEKWIKQNGKQTIEDFS